MGMIEVSTSGSFPYRRRNFPAMAYGHANAVAEAIEWLSTVVLPEAIAQDHKLQSQGHYPKHGFDRKP